ncbi:DMT family transporter [Mycolicibacterium austroafricanum]|uniref:EamA family transporter n=1 Tax=Mycolicibacterium austroafricanum TaxID=39687 RepID=A0ABT8HCL3_MYCAO|nr:EamA family transporter [Mycolicibacterium austroafricanum]MDN4518516.1 EamA family transporter [Mycolicibacterium austroafricanum]QRZ09822.1 EamA family transporter [Mycolicibacterium austroafricanum]QZT71272.1 DMT family transporter [Mycolicibacterium austroafricanum]
MTAVLSALIAALGYGVSDFVGGIASRRVAALRVVVVSYPVALVLLVLAAIPMGGQLSTAAVAWGALAGLVQAFGVWWFYAALGSGPISVVSPLTAVLVAGIPVLAGVALGERPSVVAGVGVVLALVAVVLVSRGATDEDSRPHRFTAKVAWLTVGSGVAFGMNFVILHQIPPEAKLWPLVLGRLVAAAVVLFAALVTANLVFERGVPLRLAVLAGVLDTVANVATLLALQSSMLSLAGVLIALYPAATVVLAIVVLRERVTRWQALGMVLALGSVVMIAAN